ncbi:MAG: tetratricopeptide repeat protein [Pirellula sp.]
MPVPVIPVGVSKLQINRVRRGLFASVLLMGVLPTGLAAQDLETAPLSQIRLDSSVGDIPASPWSRRNNPARPSSKDFESTVSQPRSISQNRTGETTQQEIRLGDPASRRSQSSSAPASTNAPATIRWGAIRAAGPNAVGPIAIGSESTSPWDMNPLEPSANPVILDSGSGERNHPDESIDEDIFVSSELSSKMPIAKAEAAERWVKPAATRARSNAHVLDSELDFPSVTSREKQRIEIVAQANSPIRLVPDDAIEIDTSRADVARNDLSRKEISLSVPLSQGNDSQKSSAQDESGAKRMLVAQRLSHELLSQNQTPPARAPQALENPAGWQSIEQELRNNLEKCDQLLRRGAVHSARSEVISGLRRLFRSMDAFRGSFTSEPALDFALTAFREEADFHSPYGVSSVASVVETHTTPALKNRPLDGVSPEVASQHYRSFARYQWIVASAGHRWASDLLYALGKTYEKEGELSPVSSIRLRSQAVICYQAAIQITPTQSEASNQLGYALIHLDRIEEAYDALKSSIESQPNPQAWSNLAEVYRRRGATDSANFAVQQASSLAQLSAPTYTAENPEVTQVDPAVFARYSPAQNVIAPTSNANVVNGGSRTTSATQVAKQPNFFSKMFAR